MFQEFQQLLLVPNTQTIRVYGKLVDRNGENLRLITCEMKDAGWIGKGSRTKLKTQRTFHFYCIDFYYLNYNFFVKFCVQFQGWENQFDPVLMMSYDGLWGI